MTQTRPQPTIPELHMIDTRLGIGVTWAFSADDHPLWSHWCTATTRWVNMHTPDHLVAAKDPLTLMGSLICNDCGLHGWIQEGRWKSA